MSRKLLSGLLDTRRRGRPIEPKNLYDGHCHAVSRRGNNASAADHLWMAGGDRRFKHTVLGELAGLSDCRCPRVFRLHAEPVIRWLSTGSSSALTTSPSAWLSATNDGSTTLPVNLRAGEEFDQFEAALLLRQFQKAAL